MNLSKIEVIAITGCMSLIVLLFGSWFLKYYMETITVFSGIGICFIGVLLIVWQNICRTRFVSKVDGKNHTIGSHTTIAEITSQETNNPDLFPDLNETALKKQIAVKVQECPNNQLIKHISLCQGGGNSPFIYHIVVEINPSNGLEAVKRFWEREAPDLFGERFVEIYREEPNVTFRYQAGSFWSDWNVLVVESLKEVPDDLALKKYKWLLY
ncbi:MAG: hypothetical protein KKI12_01505 [Proteobacteria bacterium]|nr:hypothetical protein [Pseudomonadota bacterium]MBU4414828.1 hypothetical protein [Pseudomonadota bacterium]